MLLAIGTDERNIRELAQEAAAALSLAERYTDQGRSAARHLDTATPATAARLMHETVLELSDVAVPVSATVAIWNGASAILQWIACGDSQPILVEPTGELELIGERQPEIGAANFPARLRIQSRRLSAGQQILFASDGVLRCEDELGRPFGLDGARHAVARAGGGSAATTVRAIEDAARAHRRGAFTDDATLMVLFPNALPARP